MNDNSPENIHNRPKSADEKPRVAITGASGLVGRHLKSYLESNGYHVHALVRQKPQIGSGDIYWKPSRGEIDAASLEGFDAIVHLAGENIAERWTDEKKQAIRDSRIQGTTLLAETVAALKQSPRVFVSASAIGYYGDRGEESLTEESAPGDGFLPEVCCEWEAASRGAEKAGLRVVQVRIGVVLSPEGGALAKMLPLFRLGLGGRLGSGAQFMSWIGLHDLIRAFHHVIVTDDVNGPVNATAPNAVCNRTFTKTLGKVLRRPTLFPAPAFMLRRALGEMADILLLSGCNVVPQCLRDSGFEFDEPELEGALRRELDIKKNTHGER